MRVISAARNSVLILCVDGPPIQHSDITTIPLNRIIKMKTAILASLIASAAAFAPAQQGQTSSALKVSELGTFSLLHGNSPLVK